MKSVRVLLCFGAIVAVCLSPCSLLGQFMPPGQLASHSRTALTEDEKGKIKSAIEKGDSSISNCYSSSPNDYHNWLPLRGCSDDDIMKYFNVPGAVSAGNQGQYLYNAKQSTNQINADLFTGTFYPGFQAILAGTATPASSQSPSTAGQTSGNTSAGSNSPTDSVQTAVAKLEQGGDFNLRLPTPLALVQGTHSTGSINLTPNVGFTVNGLTGQNTITDSTQYSINVPIEGYFETGSLEKTSGVSDMVIYFDFQAGAELISPALKTAIGLTSNRYFFLGQASLGFQISKSIRIGVQYFIGPSQIYTVNTTSGSSTKPGNLGGLHFVVSFANPASTNSNNKNSGS